MSDKPSENPSEKKASLSNPQIKSQQASTGQNPTQNQSNQKNSAPKPAQTAQNNPQKAPSQAPKPQSSNAQGNAQTQKNSNTQKSQQSKQSTNTQPKNNQQNSNSKPQSVNPQKNQNPQPTNNPSNSQDQPKKNRRRRKPKKQQKDVNPPEQKDSQVVKPESKQKVPNEIIYQIIEQLDEKEQWESLSVCKPWANFILERMYQKIIFIDKNVESFLKDKPHPYLHCVREVKILLDFIGVMLRMDMADVNIKLYRILKQFPNLEKVTVNLSTEMDSKRFYNMTLGRWKKMKLSDLDLGRPFVQNVTSGKSSLEELTLYKCTVKSPKGFPKGSNSLQKLFLYDCQCDRRILHVLDAIRDQSTAQGLTSFAFYDSWDDEDDEALSWLIMHLSRHNLKEIQLSTASDVKGPVLAAWAQSLPTVTDWTLRVFNSNANDIAQFLNNVPNATKLELLFEDSIVQEPTFTATLPNVTELILHVYRNIGYIEPIIAMMPNLKKITLLYRRKGEEDCKMLKEKLTNYQVELGITRFPRLRECYGHHEFAPFGLGDLVDEIPDQYHFDFDSVYHQDTDEEVSDDEYDYYEDDDFYTDSDDFYYPAAYESDYTDEGSDDDLHY